MPAVARVATPAKAAAPGKAKSAGPKAAGTTKATHAVSGLARKSGGSTNCGNGKGGFKPGNICGGDKRAALARDLKAARGAAKAGKVSHAEVRSKALALKAHRRGKDGAALGSEAVRAHRDSLRKLGQFKPAPKPTIGAATPKPAEAAKVIPKSGPNPTSSPGHAASHQHDNHEPGHVGHLNTDLIHADPTRFQYKDNADAKTGSVDSLAGVRKYDENLGGILQVWKDPADSKTYVVNGHNRLAKAKELGADKVTVRFLDAPNAKEARSIGALTNIAEGRGTALDAAKYFKDTGLSVQDIKDKGIPIREKVATDGLALASLSDHAFDKVFRGHLTTEQGSIIGSRGLSHAQQNSVVKLLDEAGKRSRAGEITNGHLRSIVAREKAVPTVKSKTGSLFGDSEEDVSLGLHVTKMESKIRDRLSRDKKLFGLVAKGKNADDLARGNNQIDTDESGRISRQAAEVLDIYDRLVHVKGPVSRHLNQAAEQVHKGRSFRTVEAETYKAIMADLPTIIERGHAFSD